MEIETAYNTNIAQDIRDMFTKTFTFEENNKDGIFLSEENVGTATYLCIAYLNHHNSTIGSKKTYLCEKGKNGNKNEKLSFLDLPRLQSIGNYGFKKIKAEVTKVLDKVSGEAMDFALKKENEATLEANFAMWTSLPADQRQGEKPMSYLEWKPIPTKDCPVVMLTVSFDTGWQHKES
eukprot:14555444-Ditylum_brightwellii.AAC.1